MIQDAKWRFFTPSTLSEDLVAGTTVAFLSEPIDLKAAGYADGGGELVARVRTKVTTCGAGASYAIQVITCDTVGGTYTVAVEATVLRAAIVANTEIAALRLPLGMKQFMKLNMVGASGMTGSTTFEAGIYTS